MRLRIKNSCILLLIIHFSLLSSFTATGSDTVPSFDAVTFIKLVKKFHPIVTQSNLNIQQAQNDITIAKGGFDPFLNSGVYQKTFDGQNYYDVQSAELVVPTWYGIDVVAHVENLRGARNNPDQTLGQTNSIGIQVPLAKGLLMDKRRGALLQARQMVKLAETEQRSIINNLLIEAIEHYWNWVLAYQKYTILRNTVAVSKDRVQFVRKMVQNGERPAIDTVEAIVQLQNFEYETANALLSFQNETVELSNFLWNEKTETVLLPQNIIPQNEWEKDSDWGKNVLPLNDLLLSAEKNHPDLVSYQFKLNFLDIDRKVKQQELLPKIDLKYNQLGKGYNLLKSSVTGPLFENNFNFGLKIQMPLRLSQGRGEYNNAKLKIRSTELDLKQKNISIQNKIRTYYNEYITLQNQITLLTNNFSNYRRLLQAEETRFRNGESSLFLINSRENKLLEVQQKLIESRIKYIKTTYALQWASGIIL
jgi:outer membrane protein TolC